MQVKVRSFTMHAKKSKKDGDKPMRFKIGDSVKVKKGVMCPDDDTVCMSGWQGRVFDVDDDVIGIRWDSITLRQLPVDYITKSEEEGLGWTEMYLGPDEIEPAAPRDSEKEAGNTADEMESKHQWLRSDEESKRIFQVIADAEDEIEAWHRHLNTVLTFPFEAEISEPQRGGPLKSGDTVKVHSISDFDDDDLYGLLVNVTRGRERFVLPLGDLTVLNKSSPNFLPVQDYCVWFANR